MSKAVTTVKNAASKAWNTVKTAVSNGYNTVKNWASTSGSSKNSSTSSGSSSRSSGGSSSKNLYERAKDTAVTFLKNVDWKKVAIGGAFGGSSGQFLAKAATSGSKVMSNPIVQKGLEGAVDTTMETVESAARGEKVNLGTIATSFVINTAMSGDSGNTTKTVNQLMDGADEAVDEVKNDLVDRVEQEVRSNGTRADFYVKPNGETVPATAYRYMDSKYAEQTMESMSAPGSYFGFAKFDSASEAQDAFQISPEWSDCKLRGEFDTLQVIDGMYIPKAYGDKGPGLEPFTKYYPENGKGGYQQFIYKGEIYFENVDIIND